MKKTKKGIAFILMLVLLFSLSMPAYALEGQDSNAQLQDLLDTLHESEKHIKLQAEEQTEAQSIVTPQAVVHTCHSGNAHQNCDVGTYTKNCGCETKTNFCCCGKKMNTDYFLCPKHQFSLNEGTNAIHEEENEVTLESSIISPMYVPHTCHEGTSHKRCYKNSDNVESCGCEDGFYLCCCGRVMGAYAIYCDKHGY